MRRIISLGIATLVAIWVWKVPVYNVRLALERSRQKRTMADMRTIATSLEARATDTNFYDLGPRPSTQTTARAESFGSMQRVAWVDVARALQPRYTRELPIADGWGHPFDIRIGGYDEKGHATSYAIRSSGSDGRADRSLYKIGFIHSMKEDLIFSDGNFFRYPDGL